MTILAMVPLKQETLKHGHLLMSTLPGTLGVQTINIY